MIPGSGHLRTKPGPQQDPDRIHDPGIWRPEDQAGSPTGPHLIRFVTMNAVQLSRYLFIYLFFIFCFVVCWPPRPKLSSWE